MAVKTITTQGDLQKSAVQYQKELLCMPVIAAEDTLKHMTPRPKTVGRRVVGELSGDIELAPWKSDRESNGNYVVKPRTLETFLGNCAQTFVPNDVWDTIYGSLIVRGEAVKTTEIARQILNYATAKIGKKLNMCLWSAKRDENGDTTATLFDGFDTITEKEIAAGNISTDNGNFLDLSGEGITLQNAVEQLKKIYNSASDELQLQPCKMFLPKDIYNLYLEDYKQSSGAVVYNTEFKKTWLEGAEGLCELVPLVSKKGSKYIHLTPQTNMLYGYGAGMEKESIGIEKYKSWTLTLEMAMYFGVQFESISAERLMVAKIKA